MRAVGKTARNDNGNASVCVGADREFSELTATQAESRRLLAEVHGTLFDRLVSIARKYLPDTADSEEAFDVVAEAFLNLATSKDLTEVTYLSTYVHRAVINVALNRGRSKNWDGGTVVRGDTNAIRILSEKRDAELHHLNLALENISAEELAKFINDVVQGLPRKYQEMYQLLIENEGGLTTKEISERLGIPVPTVKSRLLRLRKKLLSRLRAAFPDQETLDCVR